MRIFSMVQNDFVFKLVEIEVSLQPGLPMITIVGQPDALTRESIPKISAAITKQGFELPKARRILVNLQPQNIKKNNDGLELAIAVAILAETRQIRLDRLSDRDWFVFGDLSLKGEVLAPPSDCDIGGLEARFEFLCAADQVLAQAAFRVGRLAELKRPVKSMGLDHALTPVRPPMRDLGFSKKAARLLAIIASGEHHTMIAGPPGSGKSTLMASVLPLLEPPEPQRLIEIERTHKQFSKSSLLWRPEVVVHNSISPQAMLGGSRGPSLFFSGEISRAHHGLLIMDEFYQFDSEILESMREPLDRAWLTLARFGRVRHVKTEFTCLATTNLCHCGFYSPDAGFRCRCSIKRLRQHILRVSGPLMDRFHILAFSSDWDPLDRKKSVHEVAEEVACAIKFRKEVRNQKRSNSRLELSELEQGQAPRLYAMNEMGDRRRLQFLRVARTVADLEQSREVKNWHLDEAYVLTLASFHWLDQAQRAAG